MSLVETRSYRSRLLAVQAAPTLSDAIRCIPTHPTLVLLWMPLSVRSGQGGRALCHFLHDGCTLLRCTSMCSLRRPSWHAP